MTVEHAYEVKIGGKDTSQVTKTALLNNESDVGEPCWLGAIADGVGGIVISDRGVSDLKLVMDRARNTYRCLVTRAGAAPVEGTAVYFIAAGRDGNDALLTTDATGNGLWGHIVLESDSALPAPADTEAAYFNVAKS